MNEGIHLDLDTWIVPGQIRKANLSRGLGNRYTPAGTEVLISAVAHNTPPPFLLIPFVYPCFFRGRVCDPSHMRGTIRHHTPDICIIAVAAAVVCSTTGVPVMGLDMYNII